MLEYTFWEIISGFGSLYFWVGASLASAFLFFAVPKRSREYFVWFIFLILPSIVIAEMITHSLKLIFQVPRPCVDFVDCPAGYSFPSGHATVIFAAMTTLGLHYKKRKYFLLCLIFAEFVALSRVILGVHTIPDVLVGACIGIFVGFLVQKTYEMHYKDFTRLLKKV